MSDKPNEALADAIVAHPFTDKNKVNLAQILAVTTYGGGTQAGLLNMPMDWADMKIKLVHGGDTLFQALMKELSTEHGCIDLETACRTVRGMAADLSAVAHALEAARDTAAKVQGAEGGSTDTLNIIMVEGETVQPEKKPELNNPEQ